MGKTYETNVKKFDRAKKHTVTEACAILPQVKVSKKFDETVDVAVRLGVDPKHADQMVRGAAVLPNGTGKAVRVLVIAKGDKAKAAQDAGADFVGAEDYIDKIAKENWFEFDSMVATPDMMGLVGKIGRVLGPKGLMPNPKVGTVTPDPGKAVRELKAGRVEFRVEKAGIVHARVGKASFKSQALEENLRAILDLLVKLKPASAKGTYMKSITLSTTHGPGIKIDPSEFMAQVTGK
jgi:large subunit ribosomal protein L1